MRKTPTRIPRNPARLLSVLILGSSADRVGDAETCYLLVRRWAQLEPPADGRRIPALFQRVVDDRANVLGRRVGHVGHAAPPGPRLTGGDEVGAQHLAVLAASPHPNPHEPLEVQVGVSVVAQLCRPPVSHVTYPQ